MESKLPSDYLRIATIGKVVGLKGEINLWPISNVYQRFLSGSKLFLESGQELVIENIREKNDHYIVRFADMYSRNSVENLVNLVVYGQPLSGDVLDDGEFFVHDCIDKQIVDLDGKTHGVIVRVNPNNASDLLETDTGDLIPFRFITKIDEHVHVDVPDGLFDLNSEK